MVKAETKCPISQHNLMHVCSEVNSIEIFASYLPENKYKIAALKNKIFKTRKQI